MKATFSHGFESLWCLPPEFGPCLSADAVFDRLMQIAWIRYDTRTILAMHDQKVTQSERYALENNRDSSDLVIRNISESDAGIYICQLNTEPTQNHVKRHKEMFSDTQNCNHKLTKFVELICA